MSNIMGLTLLCSTHSNKLCQASWISVFNKKRITHIIGFSLISCVMVQMNIFTILWISDLLTSEKKYEKEEEEDKWTKKLNFDIISMRRLKYREKNKRRKGCCASLSPVNQRSVGSICEISMILNGTYNIICVGQSPITSKPAQFCSLHVIIIHNDMMKWSIRLWILLTIKCNDTISVPSGCQEHFVHFHH